MNSNFFQYRPPLHLWIVLAYWGKAIYATIYAPLLIVNYYILNSTSVIIYHIVQVVHFLILKILFRQLLESNHKTIHIWINCLYYCRQMVETDQHYIVTWYYDILGESDSFAAHFRYATISFIWPTILVLCTPPDPATIHTYT